MKPNEFICPECEGVLSEERQSRGCGFCSRECSTEFRKQYGFKLRHIVEFLITKGGVGSKLTEDVGGKPEHLRKLPPKVVNAVYIALQNIGDSNLTKYPELYRFQDLLGLWDFIREFKEIAESVATELMPPLSGLGKCPVAGISNRL